MPFGGLGSLSVYFCSEAILYISKEVCVCMCVCMHMLELQVHVYLAVPYHLGIVSLFVWYRKKQQLPFEDLIALHKHLWI